MSETAGPNANQPKLVLRLIQGGIALLVIVGVVIVILILTSHKNAAATHTADSGASTPKNMASYGVLLTGKDGQIATVRTPAVAIGHPIPTDAAAHSGTVNIVEYIDYQCPICLQFEVTNLNNTAALVATGKATLEIHPVSILDRSSQGTRYSSRAANAVDCVANFDPDAFLNVTALLYENQPQEGSTGLTNAEIEKVLGIANVTDSAVTKCIDKETYKSWVAATTAAVGASRFEHVATKPTQFLGTPTVFVNGAEYGGSVTDAAAFTAFVTAQSRG